MKRIFNSKNSAQKPVAPTKRSTTKAEQSASAKVVVIDASKVPHQKIKIPHFSVKQVGIFIKQVPSWLVKHWRGIISTILITVLAIATLGLELNTLLPGQNLYESATLLHLQSFPVPWGHAVNAPYLIPAYIMGSLLDNPLQGARAISVLYGLISTGLLFFALRIWFNIRIATVGSLLFITSSWVLHITHIASPLILLVFGPLLLLSSFAFFLRTHRHKFAALLLLVTSFAICAYIPYMAWVSAVFCIIIILFEKRRLNFLKHWQIALTIGIFTVLLVPLIISIINHPEQIRDLLGIPQNFPSIYEYGKRLAFSLSMIVLVSPPLPALHLGRLPMLDIFSSVMLILGIYYFIQRLKSRHSMAIIASMILLICIVPLSPMYQLSITILLPFIFICIISGIVELLNQWFSYFPRNPWARNFGVAMIVIAIGFASFYHLQRYFVAWPNAPETKAVYIISNKP